MLKFFAKILVVFAILVPIFFLVAPNIHTTNAALDDECNNNIDDDGDGLIDGNDPGCVNDPDPVGARDEDLDTGICDLRVWAQGGYIVYQPVTVSVDVTQSGTYRVYVNNRNPQDKYSSGNSLIFILPGSLFPTPGSYSISARRVGNPNDPFDPSVACTNSPQIISVSAASSNPYFVAPPTGTDYNFGMTTLPRVEAWNLEPGERYELLLEGGWKDFDKLFKSVSGSRVEVWTASENGVISIVNVCNNGQAFKNDCKVEFDLGNYRIRLEKAGSDENLATAMFNVVTDGGEDTFIPVFGENPCGIVCKTALGTIPTTITGFAQSILNIAIGLAGGIALILMVIGAIRVLTSSGDQQKLNAGREMIIAALAGLLFLVFSVMILAFIGIDILGIPGLRRP